MLLLISLFSNKILSCFALFFIHTLILSFKPKGERLQMKQYEITSNDADQRLDKFLKKLFPNATLSFLYKCNRKGNIKVFTQSQLSLKSLPLQEKEATTLKWKKQHIEYKLQVGDVVQIYLSDSDIRELTKKTLPHPLSKRGEQKKLSRSDIVFQDEDILVVNKNAWQNVHPADHKSIEVSLIEQVQDHLWESFHSITFKPSLIHRIDRDTSGVIMIAKGKAALSQLSADFKSHTKIQKTYFAIVLWKVSRSSWTIRKKLERIENAKNENKVQVSGSGQEAVTHYRVLEEYYIQIPKGEQCISTLEITIETGRMHQIRVHMATLWNPIIWDKNYGNKSLNWYFSKNFWVTRQMLHAWKIGFVHPVKNKKMSLEARLKKDMIDFIKKIKK